MKLSLCLIVDIGTDGAEELYTEGEILILNECGREPCGDQRKPSKWPDMKCEVFPATEGGMLAAVAASRALYPEDYPPSIECGLCGAELPNDPHPRICGRCIVERV